MKRSNIAAVFGIAAVAASVVTSPASAAVDPPGTSDDCTVDWVSAESIGPDQYFGDSRLQCPVVTPTGWRWEVDGVEIERGTQSPLGPGEVPVFDDIEVSLDPGRQLCFVPQAWGNDKGRACVTT